MNAKTIKGTTVQEIKNQLEECLQDNFMPTLATVFISVKQDINAISKILDDKGIKIIGATTAGEFTDKGIEKGSVGILLLELNTAYFTISCVEYEYGTAFDVTKELGRMGAERFSNPGFIICGSGIYQQGNEISDGIIEGSNTTVLIGGMAGDDTFERTIAFSNNFQSDNGLVALVLDLDKVLIKGQAVSGWKSAGIDKIVTKSKDNWILEIDHQPALDVIRKFLGMEIGTESTNEQFRETTMNFPFKLKLENNSTMLVPPISFNFETKGIMIPRNIPVGTKLKFTLPPDLNVIDRVIDSAKSVKEDHLDSVDAIIIFSCIGRLLTLGPLAEEEINRLNEIWNAPMAGFFSYGEFGAAPGETPSFVGTTCSWVALKEK